MTCHVTLPFVRGLSEELRRIFKDYGCSTSFKPGNTLQQLLVSPKDLAKKEETCGEVYRINCEGGQEDRECTASMWNWLKNTSGQAVHHLWCHNTCTLVGGHTTRSPWRIYRSLTRKMTRPIRRIKESIYIRMLHPDLNVNRGRHHLPPIWENLLEVSYDFRSQDAVWRSAQTIDKGKVIFPKSLGEFSFAILVK